MQRGSREPQVGPHHVLKLLCALPQVLCRALLLQAALEEEVRVVSTSRHKHVEQERQREPRRRIVRERVMRPFRHRVVEMIPLMRLDFRIDYVVQYFHWPISYRSKYIYQYITILKGYVMLKHHVTVQYFAF